RPIAPATQGIEVAPLRKGAGVGWIEADCGAEIRNRGIDVALGTPGPRAIPVVGGARSDAKGLAVLGDRAVELTLAAPELAAARIGFGEFRIEQNREVEIGLGAIKLVPVAPDRAATDIGGRRGRLGTDFVGATPLVH